MGMFDTVKLVCPKCGEEQEVQSKAGDCLLRYYDVPGHGENPAPQPIMNSIMCDHPFFCYECDSKFLLVEDEPPVYIPGKYSIKLKEKD